MFRTYLAGGMGGRSPIQVKAERNMAVKKCRKAKIFAVDPGASEQKLWDEMDSDEICLGFSRKTMKAFVTNDKWLIRKCDAMLVLTGDHASDGTWREMCYAEQIGIPVVMIAPQRKAKTLMGWSNIEVPYIVKNLKSAIKLIQQKLVPEYKAHRRYMDEMITNAKLVSDCKFSKKKKRIGKRK